MGIKEELLSLKGQNGGLLKVEVVLDWAAANRASAIAGAITWEDTAAAHAWRCQQVRHLIQIHVVNEKAERQLISLSIDRVKEGGGYRGREEVLGVPALRKVLLLDVIDELKRLRLRHAGITELKDVWAAVDKAVRRYEETMDRAEEASRSTARAGEPRRAQSQTKPSVAKQA